MQLDTLLPTIRHDLADYAVNIFNYSRANETYTVTVVNRTQPTQDTWVYGFAIAPCCHLERFDCTRPLQDI